MKGKSTRALNPRPGAKQDIIVAMGGPTGRQASLAESTRFYHEVDNFIESEMWVLIKK
ncbi:MAG: hypothetical protein AAGG75_25630 [Bacteroidota bacterium]